MGDGMTPTTILTPIVLIAALTLAATPAGADQRSGGRDRGRSGSNSSGAVHSGSRAGTVTPRGGAQARAYPAYPRGSAAVRVAPRIIGPRGVVVASPRFYRPYYAFRPRLSLGVGLWVGYPVSYPYYYDPSFGYPYPDPYGYPAPSYGYPAPYPASGYPPSGYPSSPYPPSGSAAPSYPTQQPAPGSVGVQPGERSASGGVSFEITPSTAAVFVDGTYVGTVADFGPASPPLGLTLGRHHIEVRASGYQSMAFDTDVTPGQIVPYQGTLQAQRNY